MLEPNKIRNILLDRDGTIIRDMNYLSDPQKVIFLQNAAYALNRLYSAGMNLFLVTNQSGIARGYFTHKDFWKVQEKFRSELAKYNVFFESEVYCPHDPNACCNCRKPATGLWEQLRRENNLTPEESLVIGDKLSDIIFGLNSGLQSTILVLTGKGTREMQKLNFSLPEIESYCEIKNPLNSQVPHVIAKDLQSATDWILAEKLKH